MIKRKCSRDTPVAVRAAMILAFGAMSVPTLSAQLLTVTGDTQVNSAYPSTNFGALPFMQVGGTSKAYIKFDISPLSGIDPSTVVHATLTLWTNRIGTAGAVDVSRVLSTWDESSILDSTAPALSGVLATIPSSQASVFVSVDITAEVQRWMANPTANAGVALIASATSPSTVVFFDSKESVSTSHAPQLNVTLRSGAGPVGPSGPAGFPGPDGPAGPAGSPGPSGPAGPAGVTGPVGPAGAIGPAGATGAVGPAGATGAVGPAGATGAVGPAGATGAVGPSGARGATGPAGATGAVGPAGATGAVGPAGATGAAGPPGTGGISDYGYFFNQGAQVVAIEADVTFDNNGANSGTVTHAPGTTTITVGSAGVYAVSFSVSGVEPNQFTLFVNGAPRSGATFGSGAGTQQNVGQALMVLAAGDVITLRNHSSAAAVTLQTLAGGTQTNVNAFVQILKLGSGPV